MRTDTACATIDQLVTKPGWKLSAKESDRFQDTIVLRVDYPTRRFDRECAPCYDEAISAGGDFLIPVGDVADRYELSRRVLERILEVECHEHREALRFADEQWEAPFHPHRNDGIARWGNPSGDYQFGLA